MEVTGSSIQQVDKTKTKARCRKWRLWVSTEHGRKSRRFEGTWTQAQDALEAFVSELSDKIPDDESFASYARSWAAYRESTGDYSPNTVYDWKRCIRAFERSPLGNRHLDEITPATCRDDLAWMKSNPAKESLDELSGTTMNKLYMMMFAIFDQAEDDERIRRNPLSKIKPPKMDTKEKEALEWPELMRVLDALDEIQPCSYAMIVYAIVCHGLRRAEACALLDSDVTDDFVYVHRAIKEKSGDIGETKSKAGIRKLPSVHRMVDKAREWREIRPLVCNPDTKIFAPTHTDEVIRPQNLYRWWMNNRDDLGCSGITLHQLRHSNLTHVSRHMSPFDLMRYAGWSSLNPAKVYIHDDYEALSRGIDDAWI